MSKLILRRRMGPPATVAIPVTVPVTFLSLPTGSSFTIPGRFDDGMVRVKHPNNWAKTPSGHWDKMDPNRLVVEVVEPATNVVQPGGRGNVPSA